MKAISIFLVSLTLPSLAVAELGTATLDHMVTKVGAPSLSSPVSPTSGYELSAQQGNGNVTLKMSGSMFSPPESKDETKKDEYTANAWTWSVTAQAPASKNDSTTLGTLDGLASSTTVELKITNLLVTGVRNLAAGMGDFCKRVLAPRYLEQHPNAKADDVNCDSGFVAKNFPDEYKRYKDFGYAEDSKIFSWGLDAKVGYKDFDFFQSSNLSKEEVRKSPWSAGVFGAYAPEQGMLSALQKSLFLASFNIQEAYDDAKTKTLCPAQSASSPVECISGPIGIPTETRKRLLTLEARQYVSKGIAFSLSATRDFKNKVSGVQLPIYFVGDGNGGLTGGVRLDWSSDTHQTTVGIFIGQAFQLFD
jgi:hypothetical protein